MSAPVRLLDMDVSELRAFLQAHGVPAYRAGQVYAWLMKGVPVGEMSNLPKSLRELLETHTTIGGARVERVLCSAIDGTEKYLFALEDGQLVEGVRMRYHHGNTLCLSTQAGCRMGCVFCASTIGGCVRDLTDGELLGQVIALNAGHAQRQVDHVVLMGSGEPLDNYDNTVRFLRRAHAPEGLGLSLRGMSLSTCGLVPQMRAFALENLPVTLCVSLHAPNDAIRQTLMPVAKAFPLADILDVCRLYIEKTGRRVIFEYALIAGVNDAPEHAAELARLLRGMQCHVNLIAMHPIAERSLRAPGEERMALFLKTLEGLHVSATRRRDLGQDIQGACGQLRRLALDAKEGNLL